jgi:MFS family permease
VVTVLGPLRLDEVGATGVAIGAVFLVAGVVEATLSPFAGRLSDRRGRFVPIRIGLATAAVMGVVLPLPGTTVLVGLGVVLAFLAVAFMGAPILALISEVSESAGLEQAMAFSVTNVGWSSGQLLGGAAGGTLAHASGDLLPYSLMAGVCAVTLVLLMRGERGAAGAAAQRSQA